MREAEFIENARRHAVSFAIASGVGVALSSFFALARWPDGGAAGFLQTLFIGAVIGASIYICIAILHRVLRGLLERLPRSTRIGVEVLVSLVGGFVGGVYGLVAGVRILGGRMSAGELLQGRGWLFATFSAAIAVMVSFAFEAFEVLHQRLRDREWAEKELELARSIQTRLLPPEAIEGPSFAIAARNLPARLVAGDFYDVVQVDDGSVVVVVADVAGKGMGASLIMASVKAVLPFVARQPVADAMNVLNAKLVKELGRREFVAMTFARLFPAEGTLHMVNAGCPDPYLVRQGSVEPIVVQGPRLPLGVRQDVVYETVIQAVKEGDRIVFLTDGIPEAPVSRDDQPLGYERVAAILRSTGGELNAFLTQVRSEVQTTLQDDWTALVLDVR